MSRKRRLFRSLRGERGQVLPLVVVAAFVLIGFAGLAIDLGRVWVAKQQLQRAVDAATLAAGQNLPNSVNAITEAQNYAANGTRNPLSGWGVSAGAPSITFECGSTGPNYTAGSTPTCLTDTSGKNCQPSDPSGAPAGDTGANAVLPTGATTCNEVRVSESATVTTGLLSLFIPNFTVTATSTAAARGTGLPKPMNIFVILDTTGSMDQGCSATVSGVSSPDKLDCAKAGVQALLQSMPYSSTSGVYDDVGVMVFPGLSETLTGSTTAGATGSFSGTTSSNSTSVSVSANESQYIGYTITGTGISSGTTISSATTKSPYTVTLSQKATKSATNTFTVTGPSTTSYALSGPSSTLLADETDCNRPSTTQTGSGYDNVPSTAVTYAPWYSYTSATIPSAGLGNFTNYTSPGYVDNYPGYEAVPLSSNYLTASNTLNTTSSNLVDSVDWNDCSGAKYPGGDYYGIKDFVEDGVTGQHSYLAGAISEAQYVLAAQAAAQPTRTIDGTAYPVTSGIVILSDGELNQPSSSTDGVDPGASGNVGFTSSTPCEDALNAATGAKAAGTLIFSIAYDDSGSGCDDSGSGTGPSSLTSCSAPTSGSGSWTSGPYYGSACSFMSYLSSGSTYFGDSSSSAGDLTTDFQQAATALTTGNSVLTPDCSTPTNSTTSLNCPTS